MTSTSPDETARLRLNRSVLGSNLFSGALWLVLLAVPAGPALLAGGAVYVATASLFLAAAHARGPLTRTQQLLAWATPWLVAVALWTYLVSGINDDETGSHAWVDLGFGLLIATPCFLGWQIVAFLGRQFRAWPPETERPTD